MSQDPRETEVAPTAAPPLSRPPPLLEPLGAVDLDFELPLSPLAPGLTDSDIGDMDSIISSLFDKVEDSEPVIDNTPSTVGISSDGTNTSHDLVDEYFRRALENIGSPVTPSLNLVRSLPPPPHIPTELLSPPPQFQDVAVTSLEPNQDLTAQVIDLLVEPTPAVDLLDEACCPLFTVPPIPPSVLENISDQILMPPPPPVKKGGAVHVIPGKLKAKLHTTKVRIAGGIVKISKPIPRYLCSNQPW